MLEHFRIEIGLILPQLTFILSSLFLLICFETKCIDELKYQRTLLQDRTNTLQNQSHVEEVLCSIVLLIELNVVTYTFCKNDSESRATNTSFRDKTESRMSS